VPQSPCTSLLDFLQQPGALDAREICCIVADSRLLRDRCSSYCNVDKPEATNEDADGSDQSEKVRTDASTEAAFDVRHLV